MSPARQRKEAAKRIGLALQREYRALAGAVGQDEIQTAAIRLGDNFNTNVEFIINVLKDYGGLEAKFEPMTTTGIIGVQPKHDPVPPPANDLPKMPEIFRAGCDVDLPRKK